MEWQEVQDGISRHNGTLNNSSNKTNSLEWWKEKGKDGSQKEDMEKERVKVKEWKGIAKTVENKDIQPDCVQKEREEEKERADMEWDRIKLERDKADGIQDGIQEGRAKAKDK